MSPRAKLLWAIAISCLPHVVHAAPPDMAAPFDIDAVVRERCERGIEQLRRGLLFPKTMTVKECRLFPTGSIRVEIEATNIYEQPTEGYFLVDVPGEPDVIVFGDKLSATMLRRMPLVAR